MWTNKYVGEGAYKNFRKKAITNFWVFYYMVRYCFINILKKKKKYSVAQEAKKDDQYQTG